MRHWRIGCVIVCATAGAGVLAAAEHAARSADLVVRVRAITDAPEYKHGRWGLHVVDVDTGATVYEHHADTLFVPASTTKLYSCASAVHHLGPDYRFRTPIYRRGEVKDGVLTGDLILVARGDLTLGGRTLPDGTMAFVDNDHTYADASSATAAVTPTDPLAGLKELARQVKAAGIARLTGDVLIDARLFATARSSGSGPAQVTPILVNDNVVDVLVMPAEQAGVRATVRLRPDTDTVQIDAQVSTVEKGGPFVEVTAAGPGRIVVRGRVPANGKPIVRIHAVDDPAAFARALLIECLRKEGVVVEASPLRAPTADLPERDSYLRSSQVAEFTSPPLSEAIKVTLKVSHNLYASTLPLLVATKHGERTARDGLRRQRAFLSELGVDANAVAFAGGAGGEKADSTSPRATVSMLMALRKQPACWKAIEDGMPVLGIDGTLATVVDKTSPALGKVKAKTGTLWYDDLLNDRALLRSKALAGTMTTATGRTMMFAMFVNDVPLPKGTTPAREGRALGRLCEVFYRDAE